MNDLFREINVNLGHIKRVHRFKSKDEKSTALIQSSFLLIELPDSSVKLSVLKAAKQLKDKSLFE